MTFFAYIHCKPDGTPFYAGKGRLRRAKDLGSRNPHHENIVKKYGAKNIQIGMLECSSEDFAYELEVGIIKCLRRSGYVLANKNDGGKGGARPTPETRERLVLAAKRRGVSDACRRAAIEARKGKPLSPEQKKKQSETMKGAVFSEKHRANISKSAKLRGIPPAVREAALVAVRGRKMSAEEIERRRQSALAYWDKKGRKPKTLKTGNCWDSRSTRAVCVDGVVFKKLKDAAREIGVSSSSILYALKNSGKVKGHLVAEVKNDN